MARIVWLLVLLLLPGFAAGCGKPADSASSGRNALPGASPRRERQPPAPPPPPPGT